MSDTFFTSSPHWGIYIVLYFFVGGIAGGAGFLAGLLQLFGRPADRATVRSGYQVALLGALLSGGLLTVDLTQPLRFWHMLLEANTGAPLFKGWSPMSVGAWGLLGFGVVALLGVLGAQAEQGPSWRWAAPLGRGLAGKVIAAVGAVLGLFLAGYTGVLLAVTNRPIWADSPWLGALLLMSGVSTGCAALLLLGRRSGQAESTSGWLVQLDRRVLALELVALAAFLASLGSVARAWLSWPGLLLLAVVGGGIVLPLALEWSAAAKPSAPRELWRGLLAARLVLLGGVLLRLAVLAASARISAPGSSVAGP